MNLLQFDGAANPNPGPACGAYVLYSPPRLQQTELLRSVVQEGYRYLPHATNNEAEYTGLILGLEKALELGIRKLKIEGDSTLIVNQVNHAWKVKEPHLHPLFLRATQLVALFDEATLQYIPREQNKVADKLSKEGLQVKSEIHRAE